jgi:hypothetical protein
MSHYKVVRVVTEFAALSLVLLVGVAIRVSMMGPWLG